MKSASQGNIICIMYGAWSDAAVSQEIGSGAVHVGSSDARSHTPAGIKMLLASHALAEGCFRAWKMIIEFRYCCRNVVIV